MNSFALVFLLVNAAIQLLFPRRYALLPLLIGTCYMTRAQGVEVGSFTFTFLRMLVAVGLLRVIVKGERLAGGINGLDWLMVAWAVWALISSAFHSDPSASLVNRLGLVYDACGIYFLVRVFCQSLGDVVGLCRITALLLVPLAVEMLYEGVTGHNLFAVFGGFGETSRIRLGRVRAHGPFAHSILAGTVGSVCLPLVIALWRPDRKKALLGIAACIVIIFASASSGPIISAMVAIGALFMWHWRHRMKLVRWLAVFGYIGLNLVTEDPAYYFILSRIALIGGSTGWHRAQLIRSALGHLNEWWFCGTDYTRHWMPTGVSWSADHTDITNYYLLMGVFGGLPLMLLFIAILVKGFFFVGQSLQQLADRPVESQFIVWTLGASLFAHAASCISVAYFDQSFVFLYLTFAVIGSMWAATAKTQ